MVWCVKKTPGPGAPAARWPHVALPQVARSSFRSYGAQSRRNTRPYGAVLSLFKTKLNKIPWWGSETYPGPNKPRQREPPTQTRRELNREGARMRVGACPSVGLLVERLGFF